MTDVESSEATADRQNKLKAREKALKMLRAGKPPDEVVERLRKDGMPEAQAEKLVRKADDALQNDIHTTGREKRAPRKCHQCGNRLAKGTEFCDDCGAKVLDGAEREWHRTQIEPQLEKGRKWIGVVAILYALGGVAFFLLTEDVMVLVVNFALAGIQTGLYYWAKSNLLPAAVTALVLFVTVHLASAVLDPKTILSGIIIKAVFIFILVQTIRTALQARSLHSAPA